MRGAIALAFLLAACGRESAARKASSSCTTALDPCVAACQSGDQDACAAAAAMVRATLESLPIDATDVRGRLLEQGCEVNDAALCLSAAAAHWGEAPAEVLGLAQKACRLDPHVFITNQSGRELSCQYFDRDAALQAHELSVSCANASADDCRALGDFILPYDSMRARSNYRRSCELAGVTTADQSACARFLSSLAMPPRCPPGRSSGVMNYNQCWTEAKALPRSLAAVELKDLTASDQGTRKALGKALEAKRQLIGLCHTAALRDDPSLPNGIGIVLVIGNTGSPQLIEERVLGRSNPYEIDCIVRELAGLRLEPKPTAAQNANLRIVFHSGD